MTYHGEVLRGMKLLAEHPQTLFIGQSVRHQGHAISRTLVEVPDEKKIELPVFEETQMGLSIGLALEGFIPVTIYPRFNFLLLAVNQLVNHLDKIAEISKGGWKPKVIIKTLVGTDEPLNPGPQHLGGFTSAFEDMLEWVAVEDLHHAEKVYPAHERSLNRDGSTLLVEYARLYGR